MLDKLPENIVNNLEKEGIIKLNKIQNLVIPKMLSNKNIIGVSRTGSGKTHAFLIPTFLNKKKTIIIAPTRELARQIYQRFASFVKGSDYKVMLATGGEDKTKQINSINRGFDAIIATPGRINDILQDNPFKVEQLIVDEFDIIFQMGFIDEIERLMDRVKREANFSFFSATYPKQLKSIIKKYVSSIDEIWNEEIDVLKKKVESTVYNIENTTRIQAFKDIIEQTNPFLMLIFASKIDTVNSIAKLLTEMGIRHITLHGKLKNRERTNNIKQVVDMKYKYVVCSDIASRGMDFDGASHVLHYDIPKTDPNLFVHRTGRTGRAHYDGKNLVIADKDDIASLDRYKKKGFNFRILKYKSRNWVEEKKTILTKRENVELDSKIKGEIAKAKKQKVKPGYKKKLNEKIGKIKKEARRQHIKKQIKANKKEIYKKHQRLLKGD